MSESGVGAPLRGGASGVRSEFGGQPWIGRPARPEAIFEQLRAVLASLHMKSGRTPVQPLWLPLLSARKNFLCYIGRGVVLCLGARRVGGPGTQRHTLKHRGASRAEQRVSVVSSRRRRPARRLLLRRPTRGAASVDVGYRGRRATTRRCEWCALGIRRAALYWTPIPSRSHFRAIAGRSGLPSHEKRAYASTATLAATPKRKEKFPLLYREGGAVVLGCTPRRKSRHPTSHAQAPWRAARVEQRVSGLCTRRRRPARRLLQGRPTRGTASVDVGYRGRRGSVILSPLRGVAMVGLLRLDREVGGPLVAGLNQPLENRVHASTDP